MLLIASVIALLLAQKPLLCPPLQSYSLRTVSGGWTSASQLADRRMPGKLCACHQHRTSEASVESLNRESEDIVISLTS